MNVSDEARDTVAPSTSPKKKVEKQLSSRKQKRKEMLSKRMEKVAHRMVVQKEQAERSGLRDEHGNAKWS